MKKIVISAIITPNDDAIDLEDLKKALSQLGSVRFDVGLEVELSDADVSGDDASVFIYMPSADSPPVKVSGLGETQGVNFTDAEYEILQKDGVCVSLYAQYPRADRYGAPAFAANDEVAEGMVGEYGFKVPVNGLQVRTEDRGDDGVEEIWLGIAIPV